MMLPAPNVLACQQTNKNPEAERKNILKNRRITIK